MTKIFKLGVLALILSYSPLYGQQKASVRGNAAAKKEAQLRAKPGYYNQEESLTQWKKWNEQSPEAIERARKVMLNSGMFQPDPEAKTYKNWDAFKLSKDGQGVPSSYREYMRQKLGYYTEENRVKKTRDGRTVNP